MIYNYYVSVDPYTRSVLLTLNKMKPTGEDCDTLTRLGSFKSRDLAEAKAGAHYAKACRMAEAAGRPLPTFYLG